MFKLESYITPIILNHVAKYVKNIRPTDAQVSLWEGEVAFQNLDLRLDVLEEELNLPFEFLSGHIHELTIHVPWTKITSEPINITINTIEFVLKLKDQLSNTNNGSEHCNKLNKSIISISDSQTQQQGASGSSTSSSSGYMPGLVQKIINNIAITCHNIILKYVEEDIVVSMNVQLLSVNSANDEWQSAFIDVSPMKFLLRKLIQISDLTICLDKRNSEGQIEVCQEPILYRCSLELRIVHSTIKSTIIRIGILTKSMEINISSLQFPMAMRLIVLMMALKSGDLKNDKNINLSDNINNKEIINKNQTNINNNDSYLTWMWNLLPNFSIDDNDNNDNLDNDDVMLSHYLNIGIYICNLQITLKSSEFINDSIVGTTKKIKYNSIVKITLGGIFSETLIANDINWFDTKAGISKITIEPLGNYITDDISMNLFLSSNTEPNQSYLNDSLFDKHIDISSQTDINFITNPIKYLEKNTEDYLTYRGSCIAFDMVQYKEYTNKLNDDSILNIMLNNNQLDKTITRIYLSSIRFKYNIIFLKTLDTIKELISTYDYPPYSPNLKTNDNIVDENSYLLDDRPVKICQLILQKIDLEIYPDAYFGKNQSRKRKSRQQQQYLLHLKNKLPHFKISINYAHCKCIIPTEAEKLINYITTLTTKSKELLKNCYNNFKIEFKNIIISLCDVGYSYSLLIIPKGNINLSQILNSTIWSDEDIYLLHLQLKIDTLQIKFNRPQLLLTTILIDMFINNNYESAINMISATARIDIHNNELKYLEITFTDILFNYQQYRNILRFNGYIKSLQCYLQSNLQNSNGYLILHSAEHLLNIKRKKFLLWTIQFPKNLDNIKYTPSVSIEMENIYLIITTDLIKYLQYENIVMLSQRDTSSDKDSKDNNSLKKPTVLNVSERSFRKISNPPLETIHLSSDKDEYITIDEEELINLPKDTSLPQNKELIRAIKYMLIYIQMNQIIICIPDKDIHIHTISQILKLNNVDQTKIMLPKLNFKSSIVNKYLISNTFEPIIINPTLSESFPWSCSLSYFHIINESKLEGRSIQILNSVEFNITLDLTNKKESIGSNKTFLQNDSTERIKEEFKTKQRNGRSTIYKGNKFETKPQDQQMDQTKAFNVQNITIKSNSSLDIKSNNASVEDTIEIKNEGFKNNTNISFEGKEYRCKPTSHGKLKCKLNNKTDIIINLHIDTTPIIIEISPLQSHCTITRFGYLFQTISLLKQRTEFLHQPFRIITCSEDDPIIKEFLEFDTNSEQSESQIMKITADNNLSIWLQWTITKISINIKGDSITRSKMTIELEDLIISLAKQIDYTKINIKIITFNVRYYQINSKNDEWILNDSLQIKMLGENSQSVFFNMIITLVETSSVFKKIGGARTKSGDLNSIITEIILSLQAIEIIFDMDRFAEFLPVFFNIVTNVEQQSESSKSNKDLKPISGSDLPLTYIDCKGLTIYIPVKTKSDWCNVAILKISDIQVSSVIENPYNRVPVRADVYNKAAQLGILHLPGSIVEDRQYDLTIRDISAATGSWTEILNYMKEHKNHSHNTNPAFEWNNKTINATSLEIQEMFSDFNISLIYAPCIVYNNILICGQAIEFNCLTDLIATITTDQLSMLSFMLNNLIEIRSNISIKQNSQVTMKSYPSVFSPQQSFSIERHFDALEQLIEINEFENPRTDFDINDNNSNLEESIIDSGISTYDKIRRRSVFTEKSQDEKYSKIVKRKIPCDLSFLAGIFFLKLYQSKRKLSQQKPSEKDNIEPQQSKLLIPLISISLNQPCMLLSQRIFEYSIQISLFKCSIHLPNFTNTNTNKEYPEKFFDTKRGKLNISGIPPSFLAIRVHYTKSNKSQIDCIIAKPCIFYISHNTIEHFVNLYIALNTIFMNNLNFNNQLNSTEIVRDSKIEMINHLIFNANRFYLKLDQLNLKIKEKNYEFNNILDDFRLGINFVKRPEKMNILCSFVSFYMQSKSKIILHPVALNANIDLQQEDWYNLPIISIKLNFNVIHADIGIHNIINFINFEKSFRSTIEFTYKTIEEYTEDIKRTKYYKEFDKSNLKSLSLPDLQSKRCKFREEFYRDDLRAGAFQFIETDDDSSLPMPYQINIISKNYGIICWRYPQPRKICKLHIYPIPMPIANPAEIKCQMEYYSPPHNSFLFYCDFMLSETETNEIILPVRVISSTIWRVVILQSLVSVDGECFDTSEEDEELKSLDKIDDILDNVNIGRLTTQLHPKVLVGCMRIDTLFDPDIIPKIQILLDVAEIELNLQTVQEKNPENMPPPLQKFQQTNHISTNESFLTFKIINIKIYSNIFNDIKYTLDFNATLYALCLDYGFYNQEYLLEETNFQSFIEINNKNIDSNIIIDKIHLNFGPDIMHTLMVSKRLWEDEYDINKIKYPILSRFIIANRAKYDIIFGQENTKERLHLLRHQCTMYTFFSDMHEQKLVFYINDKKTQAISIYNQNSTQYLECDNIVLIVRLKKQSSTQTIIYIKGQIELMSMFDEEFQLEFRQKNDKKCIPNQEYDLELNAKTSFCLNIFNDSDITFRLKLKNIFYKLNKGWTGDIPLKPNKNLPWLVKVPSSAHEDFISIWIRIHFEDIPNIIIDNRKPQRVLITMWPIFMLRSMFPKSISMGENTTDILEVLKGKADEYQLKVGATHETNHKIKFYEDFEVSSEKDNQNINLSLRTLKWNEFFAYDTQLWTIDNILSKLGKPNKSLWPVNDEIELQLNRKINLIENKTTPIFKYYPNQNTSCSLLLEISPWCMIINSLANRIRIQNCETNDNLIINSNYISTIFLIKKGFIIHIEYGTIWYKSLPIFFNEDECLDTLNSECLIINDNEQIELTLQNLTNLIIKIVIQCIVENDRKILIIKPQFIIINNTNENFEIIPFCIDNKEFIKREDIQSGRVDKLLFIPKYIKEKNCKGLSVEFFNHIQLTRRNTQSGNFLYFICLKPLNNFDITIPIPVDTNYNRICFTLQKGAISIPLCASVLKKNSQNYLNIFIDTCPGVLIKNDTNLNFFIAQTVIENRSSINNDSTMLVTSECSLDNFEWYQILRKNSQLYYTPPEMYINYPDIKQVYCNIALAVLNDDPNTSNKNNKLKWSKPINTDSSWEKFFFIPSYGDVKVIVCDKHKCIRISIFYISEHLEFSVKDLRSRLTYVHKTASEIMNNANTIHSENIPKININNRQPNLCIHFKQDSMRKQNIKFTIFVKEITFSLFKEMRKKSYLKTEICSLYMDDIKFSFDTVEHFAKLLISNLQIDNQLYSNGKFDFPVILCAENLYERTNNIPSIYNINDDFAKLFHKNTILKIKIDFYDDNSMDILKINCEINPIHVYIEDTYLNALLDYLNDLDQNNVIFQPKQYYGREMLDDGQILIPKDIEYKAKCLAETFKLKSIRIAPMNVMLSVHTCVHLYIALDHSPLEFSAYEQQNILTQPLQFGYTVGWHYLSGAFFGAGWVVGSLEILGSPSGLARSFSMGIRDFVSMPFHGLLTGPWGFIVGITNGSASLIRNITAGTVNSVTKLAASVARNIDRITFDDEHFQRTEALRRNRPHGFAEGFSQGLTGLGISILGAVGGLSRHPLEATSSVGIITGLGKGIVGAFTKPISGAAEFVALTGQGVLHTVGFNAMPIQRENSIVRKVALHPADGKLWKLLPEVLITDDQILFYHEATFIVNDVLHHQLKPVVICMTSSILAILELDKDELMYILPMEKVDANIDKNDNTLIHVKSQKSDADILSEDLTTSYKNQRIMNFLQSSELASSEMTIDKRISWESLEDIINPDKIDKKYHWSFYISEALGKHLLQYIQTIHAKRFY